MRSEATHRLLFSMWLLVVRWRQEGEGCCLFGNVIFFPSESVAQSSGRGVDELHSVLLFMIMGSHWLSAQLGNFLSDDLGLLLLGNHDFEAIEIR